MSLENSRSILVTAAFLFIYWFFFLLKNFKITQRPVSGVFRAWWPSYWPVHSEMDLLCIWMIYSSEFLQPPRNWIFLTTRRWDRNATVLCFKPPRFLSIVSASNCCLFPHSVSPLCHCFLLANLLIAILIPFCLLKKLPFLGFLPLLCLPSYPRDL